jgi:hypothetical protein
MNSVMKGKKLMIYRGLLLFFFSIPLPLLAQFDMTMDRISTTDVPTEITQLYYTPNNPTRGLESIPERKNRWSRCSKKNLKVKKYCQDEEIV